MKIELWGSTKKEEVEERIRMIASAAKLSHYHGSVFDVYNNSELVEDNLKAIKRIAGMGHKSVIEHDYLVFMISDVTPIIEQLLIGYRLTAFTIKSRRYVDFSDAGYYVPNEFRDKNYNTHKNNEELKRLYVKSRQELFDVYSNMIESGIPNEDARFLMPYSFYSNIFMSLNARELERIIEDFLYSQISKIQEVHEFGERLFEIVKEKIPYLAGFIEKYKPREVKFDFESMLNKRGKKVKILDKPVLLEYTPSADNVVIEHSIFYRTQCDVESALEILKQAEHEDIHFKEKMLDELIHRRNNRELEAATFSFQIPISLSILTHLTRHRMHSLLVPDFVPIWNFNDYIVPETVISSNFASVYESMIKMNKETMEEFKSKGVCDEDLIYFYLGAQMCNVVTTMNAREFIWFTRMRACNRAQWQIRDIANSMIDEVKKVAPLIANGCGPTCVVEHYCGEGKKSCGRIKDILSQKE